jgi:hypothetical protein
MIYDGKRRLWLVNMAKHSSTLVLLLFCFGSTVLRAQEKTPAEIIDYHQHLDSPDAGARSSPGAKGIDGVT